VAAFTAILDANVLYAAPVRDLLMELALSDLFRAKWTERINDEWIRHLLANRPDLTAAQLARTRALMQAHVRDCLVEDYEALIDTLTLPDPDDRHVLAAAIKGHADVIVTFNLADFPAATLARYGMEAWHPDAFLVSLMERDHAEVCAAARRVRARLRQPPLDVPAYLAALERCGLRATAAGLRALQALL
jgi:predicted nucleic acid-binding protein